MDNIKSGYITKDVRLDVHQIEFLAELVGQAQREAQDMGEVETAALCDLIIEALA